MQKNFFHCDLFEAVDVWVNLVLLNCNCHCHWKKNKISSWKGIFHHCWWLYLSFLLTISSLVEQINYIFFFFHMTFKVVILTIWMTANRFICNQNCLWIILISTDYGCMTFLSNRSGIFFVVRKLFYEFESCWITWRWTE